MNHFSKCPYSYLSIKGLILFDGVFSQWVSQWLYNCISVITDYWFSALDYVFHVNIIAYCQQIRRVWLAIFTDWLTLKKQTQTLR